MPLKSLASGALALLLVVGAWPAGQTPTQFGGGYAGLGPRRQRLVDDWVTRFNKVARQSLAPAEFYDEVLRVSSKTTLEAVTHALMTTTLTDASGTRLGDGLDLIDHLDTVRGAYQDVRGDHQFRIYVRLTERAQDLLSRSREFQRGADNTVYHKGYPTNYRQQGGAPSMQISVALDGRRADIDVDYRSSGFPAAIFNGHLTAANSDVRAGDNADRHSERWLGFQNWWRSFFGVRLKDAPVDPSSKSPLAIPPVPRAGDKPIETMVHDFMTAWLVEGNIVEAMAYVAPRAFSCLALDNDDPASFDGGMAPFILMQRLKAAYDTLGPHTSLDGLTLGVRLASPALRVVRQPHHPQVVVYSVPDDVAKTFDCQERLTLGDSSKTPRAYGKYHGAVFHVNVPGGKDNTVALLWAKDAGYWKIVSWRAQPEEDETRALHTTPEVPRVRIPADASLVTAARGFLESWLIKKDYETAFASFSPASYPCYDLARGPNAPASTSVEDAGRQIRAAIERAGNTVGPARDLPAVLAGVEPIHPAIRVMNHPSSSAFALSSLPDGITAAVGCAARARGEPFTGVATDTYGRGFGMTVQFRTRAGDAPVLRVLWMRENGAWRITAYDVEFP